MVNTIIFIVLTYAFTLGINVSKYMEICKDAFDKGYKLNGSNVVTGRVYSYKLEYLPIFNMVFALINYYKYISNADNFVRKNIFKGEYIPLSNIEKKEFELKPTRFNALRINYDSIVKHSLVEDVVKDLGVEDPEAFITKQELKIDEENIIRYQFDLLEQDKGFVITSAEGKLVSKLNSDEQLDLIYDYMELLNDKIEEYIKEYYKGNRRKFEDDLLNNNADIDELKREISNNEIKEIIESKIRKLEK